jgi:hypothetical protein
MPVGHLTNFCGLNAFVLVEGFGMSVFRFLACVAAASKQWLTSAGP